MASSRTSLLGVAVGLGAPRLPRRGFETLRVRVTKEQEVLFDATYRDRDEAVRGLEGRVIEVGELGGVIEGIPGRQTERAELARLRVELTGVRTTDEFALRYAVAADPFLIIVRPLFPGGGEIDSVYRAPEVVGFPGVWLELGARLSTTRRILPLPELLLPDVFLPVPPGADGFNDLSDGNDAGGALARILGPGAIFSTTPIPPDLSGL